MTIQTEIIGELNVSVSFEARRETVGRTRFLSDYMERSAKLIGKVPTADLDDGAPLRPDEDVFGVTYDQIDDFLEGKAVNESVAGTIASAYRATAHKRTLPVAHSSRSGRQER